MVLWPLPVAESFASQTAKLPPVPPGTLIVAGGILLRQVDNNACLTRLIGTPVCMCETPCTVPSATLMLS